MTEEQKQVYNQMVQDARKYVHNLMDLPGMYDQEGFENIIKDQQKIADKLFAKFDDTTYLTNKEHLLQGYCTFGTEFIKNLLEKDKDSAIVLFETAIQLYLDLNMSIKEAQNWLQTQADAKKEIANNSYNEVKEEN